ncbi:HNH endonuclease [Desulfovibrio intestinalis]|uniref:5-methylcytosine-specific restriction endonuclease McrA n=1 Tax=Desulfovibrio intestinalis TaxID=58621 RepID=A0A7W8C3E1_9BACT|nr:HNH endonuclease [Desulfovibrio intestinalis]MBB5143712.1 5-methylcytosine-specific restriction endonuclease McrA [Desulfovibrio intestinalis]
MLKFVTPQYTNANVLSLCEQGIHNTNHLHGRFHACHERLLELGEEYISCAEQEDLYTLNAFPVGVIPEPPVVGTLTKNECEKLYTHYFAKNNKPARIVYDTLLAAAAGKCPYCCGIGNPSNLDHYLPKTHYPQFSILPLNLVPACRDCNMGSKANSYAMTRGAQVFHPYFDDDCYTTEQWLFAQYIAGKDSNPSVIDYNVIPPAHWNRDQKQRVEMHFKTFNLRLRFSRVASSCLNDYLSQIKRLYSHIGDFEESKRIIVQPIIDKIPEVNHWKKSMCIALLTELMPF